ncbi:acetyl-CoA C-acyltransferase [Fictibacillus sp. Mic-4]|uniref:acetyl-CoA C-acyltransferase n=1 Tax=Fictibacillus sp. Mic-4 TaxID=3132826 RepID=UPI003CF357C5
MDHAVIIGAKRTVIGKKGGILKNVPPENLAATVMKELVKQYSISPEVVSDVILGNVVGPGGNMARLSALTAGFPFSVPGVTIDRQCGSGLEAINIACRLVRSGAGDIYLAGGVESSSLSPFSKRARFSPDSIGDPDMGAAAENVAEKYNVSREEQDDFALLSYQKAIDSTQKGRFINEIVPMNGILHDEGINLRTNYKKLIGRARPVFKEGGTVTAANSCGVNDGAAVVLVMSEKKAESLGLTPALRFIDSVVAGVDPNYPGVGPVPAVKQLLTRNGLSVDDIDLVELNEAFAAQVLASIKELNIPIEKLNRGGGAIAFGHPYGASGAILVTRLCSEMKRMGGKFGLATLGIGGGMGLATLFENMQ